MDDAPGISDAEWDVMNVVWDDHPIAASDVAERLVGTKDWSDRTVKTLLGRLVRKGALGFRTAGRRYLYHPKVTRDDCVRARSRSFIERVFGGAASPALLHLVRETDLSDDDIAELRRILGEKESR